MTHGLIGFALGTALFASTRVLKLENDLRELRRYIDKELRNRP